MIAKDLATDYSCISLAVCPPQEMRPFPTYQLWKKGTSKEKEVEKQDKKLSQFFKIKGPLNVSLLIVFFFNFMGMKFGGKCSLEMFFVEFQWFGVFAPKFYETFRRSPVEFLCFLTRTMLIVYYNYVHLAPVLRPFVHIFFPLLSLANLHYFLICALSFFV